MQVELLGSESLEEIERRLKIIAGAAKLSRFKGNVFEVLETCNDYNKNLNLIKRVIGMGHETIIEHDYLVFALSDISPIVEQTIIGSRLASFTIKSGREVDFRNVGYYVPEFRQPNGDIHLNNDELKIIYQKHMDTLFKEYGYFVDNNINVEDARFILPYSFYTNIVMGMNARELERLIISLLYGKLSNIAELKEFGEKLVKSIESKVPYLVSKINDYQKEEIKFFDFDEHQRENNKKTNILSKPELLSYTDDVDEKILIRFIMGKWQCNEEKAIKILNNLSADDYDFKNKLMKYIITKSENRELEFVNFEFQIPISLIILKHFTRHRMQSLITPDFVPMWDLNNYIIPPSIEKFNSDKYYEIHAKNIDMYNYFKSQDIMEEDLIYFYLCGQMCNVITNMNGRTLSWISKLRTCNKSQWQIKNIMKEADRLVKAIAPLYGEFLGPSCKITGDCPEGPESCRVKVKK